MPEWAKRKEVRRFNPSYDTDETVSLENDRLGVRRDAEALADLICLRVASPPLAIGLFGDWGSGKSTFMHMLEEAVDRATEDDAHTPDLFIKNVVHIRFNAWHYIDANLWASLVSHIFRELYDQTHEMPHGRNWLDATQLNALLARLEGLRTANIDRRECLSKIETKIDVARERLTKINNRQLKIQTKLLVKYSRELIDSVSVEDPDGVVKDAARALGLGDNCPSARQLRETAQEAFTLGGRIKLLVTSFGSAGLWPLAALMLGLVVFVGFVIGLPWIVEELGLTGLRAAVDQVGALVAVVLGFVAWLGPHLTFINHKLRPLFDAYGRVVDKEKQAHAQREAEAAVMEQELQKLRARQTEQERIVAEQESERVSLEALASGERPNELLARFIEDRARGEGYRKHLGLVSLVRRDFQAMSDLMRDLRKEREAEAAGRNERKTDHTTIELPPIDRIVLYVDDLDRCRHEQVVDMLEAVHLLLAFDLFVVVVGVDERWLRQSLRRAYPGQLANKHDGREPRASPADYLAKIFQIPIWIRPLSFGKQGNYPDLLSDLIGDEVVITKDRIDQEPGDIQQPAAVQRLGRSRQ